VAVILRNELLAAPQTASGLAVAPVLAPTVRVESRSAVRTDDLKVLEPVVCGYAGDVIENQRHLPAAPLLPLSTQLAAAHLQASLVQAPLEVIAVV
jgi:hypothetical protein